MLENILPQIHTLNSYTAIVADGEFPKHPYLHKLLSQADNIVCCDGAAHKLLDHGFTPNYIIGDCDSHTLLDNYGLNDRIITIKEQDTNDLTKAVYFAKKTLKPKQLVLLGATGLREDHAIANIALLAKYIEIVTDTALISDYGIFTAHSNNIHLKTLTGQQVSFFTLDANTVINCNGLKWALVDKRFTSWYQGSLNEALSDKVFMEVKKGIVIVYRAFAIK